MKTSQQTNSDSATDAPDVLNVAEKMEFYDDLARRLCGDIVLAPLTDGEPDFLVPNVQALTRATEADFEHSESIERVGVLTGFLINRDPESPASECDMLTRFDFCEKTFEHFQIGGSGEDAPIAVEMLKRGIAESSTCAPPSAAPQPANDNVPQLPQQEKPKGSVTAKPFLVRPHCDIPRREFLHANHYLRGFLTATFGAGGGGKSAHAVTEALAMVTGRPLLSGALAMPLRVWYVNAEDPADEIERRFSGSIKHFKLTADHIGDRLFANSGREQEFVVMTEERRETKICVPFVTSIIEEIQRNKIDVLIVDPFVSTHEVDEQDNSKIQRVAAVWNLIADKAGCSVELIHHVRKTKDEITADDGRGAGALKDKCRSVRVINPMSIAQAQAAGLDEAKAASYFRIEVSKANMALLGGHSPWRRFASVKLDNGGTGDLSSLCGDSIGVVEKWDWPSAETLCGEIPPEVLDKIKARIGAGSYRESAQSPEWAGLVVGEELGIEADPAGKRRIKVLLKQWVKDGHFAVEDRLDRKRTMKKHIVLCLPHHRG